VVQHLNDKTHKYLSYAQSKRQHEYLGLPGKFKARCSQEIVFKNMEIGRRDEFYLILCVFCGYFFGLPKHLLSKTMLYNNSYYNKCYINFKITLLYALK